MRLGAWLALLVTIGLSGMVSLRRAQHWPVTAYLTTLTVCDAVPLFFDVGNGLHRLLWLAHGACFVALCGYSFKRRFAFREPWAFELAVYLLGVSAMAAAVGASTEAIHELYAVQGALAVGVAVVAIWRW